ncbi:TIGR03668 family PPOX class F420-dependent oxidoreductase [Phytohabitans houttuyneae]|uniref:PPOX class F420-dependent oxidoreductase n=1 Tax=Phytohabitans houttuyneae TaxID=1076126 RepID=A0A6V8KBP7_9ACTN|nr:TIGR03668 family PPOX class F420-dependent oxidoreductase [Phytohabitans houttuyneae]GFJ78205.1 PPOX class F420-dependent oxidoreductase [Phytohabitans houttuyneae]
MTPARARFAAARVATLATVDSAGAPHVVPVTFALDGDTVWSAVDAKPKRSRALRRLDNIRANPRVSLLAQHWDEEWSALWWVRADGLAVVTEQAPAVDRAVRLLREKYAQYRTVELPGPIIEVTVRRWRDWSAS